MRYYAQVRDGVCVASLQTPNAIDDAHMIERSADAAYLLGWLWNGSTFYEPAPVVNTVLSTLALKRRLTATERIAMRTRAKTDPLMADLLDLLDSAQHADLADADLNMGLQYAESKGDLAPGRALAVLSAPVLSDEGA